MSIALAILAELIRLSMVLASVVGVLYLWRWRNWHQKPFHQDGNAGTIVKDKIGVAVNLAFAIGLSLVGFFAATAGHFAISALSVAAGLACSACVVILLVRHYDVQWTAQGIEGPRAGFRIGRTFIRWEEIAAADHVLKSVWYVQAQDGRRIYWGIPYKGWDAPIRELRKHRPELLDIGFELEPKA